jgi:hypothetical protein
MSRIKERVDRWYLRWSWFGVIGLPSLLIFLVGLAVVTFMLQDIKRDTTGITNTAFAIVGSLAALSFSCARAVSEEDASDRILYAGERFFHAGVLLIMASVLKYSYVLSKDAAVLAKIPGFLSIVGSVVGWAVALLFFWSLISAHAGLKVVNRMLWRRMGRRPDWDDWKI